MAGLLSALRFLRASTLGPGWEGPRRETTLALAGGPPLETDVYEGRGGGRGALLFVHGMSRRAHRDPRQIAACRALAAAGYRVIAPRVPSLAALQLCERLSDDLAEATLAAVERPDLGAGAPLGLFSVSFSAAACLVAAARPELRGRVAAVCAIGTFSDGLGWARWLMSSSGEDDYGRLVLLRNFAPLALDAGPGVLAGLDAAIADHHAEPGALAWPEALARLSGEERALLLRLREDRALGLEVLERADALGRLDVLRRINPVDAAPRLSVPVTLLHGASDPVIPAQESRDLHALLRAGGAPSRLVVTRLLTHGDTARGPRALLESFALIRAFAHYFGAIDAAARRAPSR